jgi:hypothetical protein
MMEKQLKIELRKLLTGRTMRDEEGWLVAVPDGQYLIYHGITDLTGFRKIKQLQQQMQVAATNEEAFHKLLKALQEVGMLVNMQTKPDALCALCHVFLTRSVVLCAEPKTDGVVQLQVYTGRSLLSGLWCRLAVMKLMKKLELE